MPAQLARLRHDIGMWRVAVAEAEQGYYPHRVKMQTMFIDTVLNLVCGGMHRAPEGPNDA